MASFLNMDADALRELVGELMSEINALKNGDYCAAVLEEAEQSRLEAVSLAEQLEVDREPHSPARLRWMIHHQPVHTRLQQAREAAEMSRRDLARITWQLGIKPGERGRTNHKTTRRGGMQMVKNSVGGDLKAEIRAKVTQILRWEAFIDEIPPAAIELLSKALHTPRAFLSQDPRSRPKSINGWISIGKAWECDVCMEVGDYADVEQHAADEIARAEGWHLSDQIDLCPECYRKPEIIAQFEVERELVVPSVFYALNKWDRPSRGGVLHWSGRAPDVAACSTKQRIAIDHPIPATQADATRCRRAGCRHRWEKYDAAVSGSRPAP